MRAAAFQNTSTSSREGSFNHSWRSRGWGAQSSNSWPKRGLRFVQVDTVIGAIDGATSPKRAAIVELRPVLIFKAEERVGVNKAAAESLTMTVLHAGQRNKVTAGVAGALATLTAIRTNPLR